MGVFTRTQTQEDIARRQRDLYLDARLVEDVEEKFVLSLHAHLDEFDELGCEMVRAYVRTVMERLLAGSEGYSPSDTAGITQHLGNVLLGRAMEHGRQGRERLFETYSCLWYEWDEWRHLIAPGMTSRGLLATMAFGTSGIRNETVAAAMA